MKDLVNNISKGKNLEINLPKFGQEMMTTFYRYGAVRLAMNHYTYSETFREQGSGDESSCAVHLRKLADSYMEVVNSSVVEQAAGVELEEAVKSMDVIRNEIIQVMKGLTSLVDVFNIYEYVMNRVEYRFKDGSDVNVKDDDTFTGELMQYMLYGNDNMLTNIRITEAVRQLPMRMTKSRFFELLKEGLKVYKDSEKSSVDDYVYMIESSAMVYTDDYTKKISEDINSIIDEFENVDFNLIDEEKYNNLRDKLTFGIDYVQKAVDDYMLLAELVNDGYALLLSAPYADTDCEERDCLITILKNADDGSAEETLVSLEGKQEKLHGSYSKYEYMIKEILDERKDMVQSLMLEALYNSLEVISTLESGSHFVEFGKEIDSTVAGEAYVMEKYESLSENLKAFFKGHNKLVNRAVMAHVLASLPVFFNNVDEIQNYVYSSISGCSDMAEKTACQEIFATMMEEDGFNVVS